jgi:hypothetical protein
MCGTSARHRRQAVDSTLFTFATVWVERVKRVPDLALRRRLYLLA